ncbi:hypothetical protein, partial [Nocardiopsis tropica]
ALLRAGVELGEHDDRIIRWFADFADWSTLATITSWIERARTEDAPPEPGAKLAPVLPGLDRVVGESFVADYEPGADTPSQVWHVTERAVTPVPSASWTPRLLATLDRTRRSS